MRLIIHGLGATAGGGLTYLRNVIPHIAQNRGLEVSLLAGRAALEQLPPASNVRFIEGDERPGLARFFWEQRHVPRLVRETRADVLLCTGNFSVWRSAVPQILLSRNSLYTSSDFARDLRRRHDYRALLDLRLKSYLARKSIDRAELTIAPSEAFARELSAWAKRPVVALHHGFDPAQFFADAALPPAVQEKLKRTEGEVRLLFVSHYNYYRNFETLFRGLRLLKDRNPARKIRLLLTCELSPGKNPGSYRTEEGKSLIRELQIEDNVEQLGVIPYPALHNLYRSCDIYVSPAYTETFAHPLVEAMASGIPIVASDLAVHREITNGGAMFFERFSAAALANCVDQLLKAPELASSLRAKGLAQARNFSWKLHVDGLIGFADSLLGKSKTMRAHPPH